MTDIRLYGVASVAAALITLQAVAQLAVTPAPKDKPSWTERFEEKKKAASNGACDIAFIGDSITHFWERPGFGQEVWNAHFTNAPYRAINFGISGDRTENVLWRLRNGQLDGISPKAVVLMIGTNNTGHRSVEEERPLDTILGVQSVIFEIRKRLPSAVIILHPIFPRGATKDDPLRVRNDVVNAVIKGFADEDNKMFWCDFNSLLLTEDGVLEKSIAKDLLHPGRAGYEIWAKALKPYLDYALGLTKKKPPQSAAKPAPTALDRKGPRTMRPVVKRHWLSKAKPRLRTKRAEFLAGTAKNPVYDGIWLGDSITHGWDKDVFYRKVFKKRFAGYRFFNCGYGGDHTENLLWNITYGGFLDGVEAKTVSIMIGTNNTWNDSPEDIAAAIKKIIGVVHEKQPNATVLLYSILPREVARKRGNRDYRRKRGNVDETMPKIEKINSIIRRFADGKTVVWVDLTKRFTDEEGLPDVRLFSDGTHPNVAGYEAWADEVLPVYHRILGLPRELRKDAAAGQADSAGIVIYGGTSAGIAAAVQAARMGVDAVVVSPETRIGGLTTGGLGQTDIGNKAAIGGIAREFYRAVKAYYADDSHWKFEKRADYKGPKWEGDFWAEDAMWTFEPKAALEILEGWVRRDRLRIVRGERLDRGPGGVAKENGRIVSIRMESGRVFKGRMFIDATYEGDLMAAAGVSCTVGREDNSVYGETLNGCQPYLPSSNNHNFKPGVSAYVKPGDPLSGLLPGIEKGPIEAPGTGDRRVQAYCFRSCLTDDPRNRIPFAKPEGYDERDFELLFRNLEAGEGWRVMGNCKQPNRKTDTNNNLGTSLDYIGANWDYAEASYEEREKIVAAHLKYQQGLFWTLAYHPRTPEAVRDECSKWGTCKDEFADGFGDGWQRQLYVREARRMVGEYVMTEHNCTHERRAPRPVALAAYTMDSHHVRRYETPDGLVRNEGNVEVGVKMGPYPVDYGAIVPKRGECENILVPVCLSASHIAYGSIRMEPVFFELGQAAAAAAALAIESGRAVQDVDYPALAKRLVADGQIIDAPSGIVERGRKVTDLSGRGWTLDGVRVEIPHTWNAQDGADGTGEPNEDSASARSYARRRGVYRRALPVSAKPGRRCFVRCLGAAQKATVKVNGTEIGRHVGSFTAFCFEATKFLKESGNVLEVEVDNTIDGDVPPVQADFTVFGGLYRGVEMIETDGICIDCTTDGADGVRIDADPDTGDVVAYVSVDGGTNEMRRFSFPDRRLWSPEDPALYTLDITVSQGGCTDTVKVPFGFRKAEFREDGFYLNGVKRKIRGVNMHQDMANRGWAVSPARHARDIATIKEMGADGLRTAHYPHAGDTYGECDRQGLLVWCEYPNVNNFGITETYRRRALDGVREMIAQLRNHPSIVAWSVANEYRTNAVVSYAWLKRVVGDLAAEAKRLDPSRATAAATCRSFLLDINAIPDVLGFNFYPGWYRREANEMKETIDVALAETRRGTIGVTEYGAGGNIDSHASPEARNAPLSQFHAEEYQAWVHRFNYEGLRDDPRVWGSFVWAMFDFGADARREGSRFGMNDKGLVCYDHETKKDAFFFYKANWTSSPVLHLVGKRAKSFTNEFMTVMAFWNGEGPVTLKVNGRDAGSLAPDGFKTAIWRGVRLEPGFNDIEVSAGGLVEKARWGRRVAASPVNVPPLMAPGTTKEAWESSRRPEIVKAAFEAEYGVRPVERPADLRFTEVAPAEKCFGGTAVRKRVKATFSGPGGNGKIVFSVWIPLRNGKAPVFVHSSPRPAETAADPDAPRPIYLLPAEAITRRGYAAVAYCNQDVCYDAWEGPEFHDRGVFSIYGSGHMDSRGPREWGILSAWAWGVSRIVDWIETEPLLDASKVAVVGLSRNGKTAIVAGASDPRIALTISCCSGCGGAKLNHVDLPFSESIDRIYAHQKWFAPEFFNWRGRDRELPWDQHWILSLVAPRLLYVSSAENDDWAGPDGEVHSARLASPTWELYGKKGLVSCANPPAVGEALQEGSVGYHRRPGKHAILKKDWTLYMDFAARHGWK